MKNFRHAFMKSVVVVLLSFLPFSIWAEKRKITVLSTNDFHGALTGKVQSWSQGDRVGGAEWLAGYFNIIKDENPGGVIFLDSGDMFQGTLISNHFKGASTVEVFNTIGLDAMALGNHEIDWGQDILQKRSDQANVFSLVFMPP